MKQSDIFTIIIIASIGMVAAFFASNALLGNPDELSMKHKTITPISTEIVEPDPETFNLDAINPTVEVYVGQCEDVDQNGILDRAELVACGKATPKETVEDQKKAEEQKKTEDRNNTNNQTNTDTQTQTNTDNQSNNSSNATNQTE